jgi:hypothetical protein
VVPTSGYVLREHDYGFILFSRLVIFAHFSFSAESCLGLRSTPYIMPTGFTLFLIRKCREHVYPS